MHASYQRVQRLFEDGIRTGRIKVHRDYSTAAAAAFPDHCFDGIYIDAARDYMSVNSDLHAHRDKVKPDGFILGHEFSNCRDRQYFGVIPAVREFTMESDFELLLFTS
jgi:hypothetical protein